MIQNITKLLNSSKDKTSILIQFIHEKEPVFEKDSDVQLISASTIKVPIMCAALHQVMNQKLSLNQIIPIFKEDILSDTQVFEDSKQHYTLEELISWMIISSDNTATNILIRTLGIDYINQYCTEILMTKKTKLERIMLDFEAVKHGKNNYTSQKDQLSIYTKLYHHQILNDELCEKALEILSNQREQNHIMRYIPFKTEFMHKTGNLDYLSHDCGIMMINKKPVYIGVSIWDSSDIDGNQQLLGKIGRLVYDTLKKQ